MNALILPGNSQVVTMSSREIAELTRKQHPHVKRDIEKMLAELGEDVSKFGRIYLDSMNREQTEFVLDRELTETLLTGYSAIARRAVIARWHKLEGEKAAPTELSRMDILTLAMESEKGRLLAVKQLAIAMPKADALDRLSGADSSMCITNAAKHLQVQPKRLFTWLSENRWIYRRAGGKNWIAYQDRIQSGHLGHNIMLVQTEDGEKAVPSVFVTTKGLAKLAEVVAQ